MILVILTGVVRAALAMLLLAATSLIGFAITPAALQPRRRRTAFVTSLSIGSLAFGWTSWLLGTTHSAHLALPLLAVATIASLRHVRAWWLTLRAAVRDAFALARANALAACATALMLLCVVPQLLIPLVDSDGLHYHVGFPKLWLLEGRIGYNAADVASALPQTAEALYLAALQTHAGGETAKFVHFTYLLAALATLMFTIHRGRRSRLAAALAPLLLVTAPVLISQAGAAFIDETAVFHCGVALLLLIERERALTIGLTLGAALATKITTAPVVAMLAIVAALNGTARMRRFAIVAAAIAIAYLPFGARNLAHTGDPFFPLGYTLLHRPMPGVSAERLEYATMFHSRVAGPLGIGWVRGPDVEDDEVAGLHHAFGLFAIAITIVRRRLRPWLTLIVPYLALSLVMRPPTRYLLPMFYALAALEAEALVLLLRKRVLATLVAIVVVIPGAIASIVTLLVQFRPLDYLVQGIPREAFLSSRVPGYRAAQLVNGQPAGGRVLALDFPAVYYLDRPWIAEGVLNESELQGWIATAKSADDVLATLHARGVRYVIVTPGYGGGTRNALLPLARNAAEARRILDLRRKLVFVGSVDSVDVLRVP